MHQIDSAPAPEGRTLKQARAFQGNKLEILDVHCCKLKEVLSHVQKQAYCAGLLGLEGCRSQFLCIFRPK